MLFILSNPPHFREVMDRYCWHGTNLLKMSHLPRQQPLMGPMRASMGFMGKGLPMKCPPDANVGKTLVKHAFANEKPMWGP